MKDPSPMSFFVHYFAKIPKRSPQCTLPTSSHSFIARFAIKGLSLLTDAKLFASRQACRDFNTAGKVRVIISSSYDLTACARSQLRVGCIVSVLAVVGKQVLIKCETSITP